MDEVTIFQRMSQQERIILIAMDYLDADADADADASSDASSDPDADT
jgi:hypothetical protein